VLLVVDFVFTHACIAASVGRVFSSICLFVHTITGKQLELSTSNLVHVYSIAVAWHALTKRSKGYENCHVRIFASDHSRYCVTLCYLWPLPMWVCMSIPLPMFSVCVYLWLVVVSLDVKTCL